MKLIDIEAIKCRKNAKELKYAHGYEDSGLDLHASVMSVRRCGEWHDYLYYALKPSETILVKTGWKLKAPIGYEFQVRPTSGNSLKTKLRIANAPGTIDAGYEDEIGIIVENIGTESIELVEGSKIAQLVLAEVIHANFKYVEEFSKASTRGLDGFGSTGTILETK